MDDAANEVFVADAGNRRVVVFDADTGAYKRHWFAYGETGGGRAPAAYSPADPPAKSFRDVTCLEIARDGQVYVCDRSSNRIQVFQKDGKFVKEGVVSKNTLGATVTGQFGVVSSYGSAWDIAFSSDAQQRLLFVADGHDKKVHVLQRDTLAPVGTFGAAAATRGSSSPSAASPSTRRATSTRASSTTASASRSSSQGGRVMKRNLAIGGSFLAVLAALCGRAGHGAAVGRGAGQGGADGAALRGGPDLPQAAAERLVSGPDHRPVGGCAGPRLDRHRPDVLDAAEGASSQTPPTGECCNIADPILEFDQAGNLLRHWGGKDGPGYQWPDSNHGLNIDNKGNIWIGGNGAMDGHVLKFTLDGKFVMQVGKKGVTRNSLAQDHFFQVAKTFFYQPTDEVFVADGYGNRRVAVIDAQTGKMKRFWGAYGKPPDDKAALAQGPYDPTATYQHFRGPVHCADVSNDGLVYVCDRTSNRLQIFKVDGTFVKEVYMARDSRADGAVWDMAFSRDAQQKYSTWPTAAIRRCASSIGSRWRS